MRIRQLNGLGLTATARRRIKHGFEFDKLFPKPRRTDPIRDRDGDTFDTVRLMKDIVANSLSETSKIATVLKGANLEETCRKIFDFLYRHVQYKLDSPAEEQLRNPARTWADRRTGVDCDCYSIFISSVLSNLGVPHYFRKTAYTAKRGFQHIYVVVPKYPGASLDWSLFPKQYYTVDPVLNRFNEEKTPIAEYRDFKVTLPAKSLNGFSGATGAMARRALPLNGLGEAMSGSMDGKVYYSKEAETVPEDVTFFDGVDYYERIKMPGLGALNGWLKKLWRGVKKVGKKVWKVAKKVVKPLVKIAAPIVTSIIPGGGLINAGIQAFTSGGGSSSGGGSAPANNSSSLIDAKRRAEIIKRYGRPYPAPAYGPYNPIQQQISTGKSSLLVNALMNMLSNQRAKKGGYDVSNILDLAKSAGLNTNEVLNLIKSTGMSPENAEAIAKRITEAENAKLKADMEKEQSKLAEANQRMKTELLRLKEKNSVSNKAAGLALKANARNRAFQSQITNILTLAAVGAGVYLITKN
ncbi:hypothetical protein FUAX_09920 [Fulvitalea axinellae]|uniref:Transglutaminase-like domain-containing protein n=1 Tax=Fulvitalea axinellae TaxID=1182444 RepID=A0AAU9DCI9_9BACT|nr:hypothetical protein FUAX_09920 [Fulvitalea axinellae]